MNAFSWARHSAATILTELDTDIRKRVIMASAVFPKTSNISVEEAAVLVEYDGSAAGFSEAVEQVRRHPELIALGSQLSVLEVLDAIKEGVIFLDLSLDHVDHVIIQRTGRHILRMTREGKPGTRSLFIELNDIRIRASEYLHQAKAHAADVVFSTMWGLAAAAVFISVVNFFRIR